MSKGPASRLHGIETSGLPPGPSKWGELYDRAISARDASPEYRALMENLQSDPALGSSIMDQLAPDLNGQVHALNAAASQRSLASQPPGLPPPPPGGGGGGLPPPPSSPQPGAQGGPTSAAEIMGLPRAISTSFDLSAPLRQGIVQAMRHPILAAKNLMESVKVAGNDAYAAKALTELHNRPTLQRNADLFGTHVSEGTQVAGPHGQSQAYYGARLIKAWSDSMRAAGHTGLAEVGHLVERSERSFNYFLNAMRQDVTDYYADKVLGPLGKMNDPALTHEFGKWINNSTGYGDVPSALKGASGAMNQLFFSPRMIFARLAVLNPKTYLSQWESAVKSGMSGMEATKLVAKGPGADLAALTGGVGMAVALTSAMGKASGQDTHVEDDPRSGDFLKVRLGNTRVDYLGGFQPYLRFAAQMLSGERKDKYGNVKKTPRGDIGLSFLRSRLAPVPGLGVSFLTGRDYRGQETGTRLAESMVKGEQPVTGEALKDVGEQAGGQLANTIAPMAWQDIAGAMQEDPAQGLALSIPSLLGVGVTTHAANERVGAQLEKEFYRLQVSPPSSLSKNVTVGKNQLGKGISHTLEEGAQETLQKQSDLLMQETLKNLVSTDMYKKADDKAKKLLLMLTVRDLRSIAQMRAKGLAGPPSAEEFTDF